MVESTRPGERDGRRLLCRGSGAEVRGMVWTGGLGTAKVILTEGSERLRTERRTEVQGVVTRYFFIFVKVIGNGAK